MATWLVRLRGELFDLQELPEIFRSDELSVVEESKEYFAKSIAFDQLTTVEAVHSLAEEKIKVMSDVLIYHFIDFEPIKLDGSIIQITLEGERHTFALASAHARGRSRAKATGKASHSDGTIEPILPHDAVIARELAEKYIEVADVLHFFAGGTWLDLYKAYELIWDDVGNERNLERKHWVDKDRLSSFTGTAQSRSAIGNNARHARRKYIMPQDKIMSLNEAKSLLKKLINRWVQSKM